MPSVTIPVGLYDDPLFERHRSRGQHPERPERLIAARVGIARSQIPTIALAGRDAEDEEILRVHTAPYLDDLNRLAGREGQIDADTYLAVDSIPAARRAAGSACAMVDAMLKGQIQRGVALLRPPGHHARADQAMGFCLLNNAAIAAAHARAEGVDRVAIIDWDVHHGNGTQEIFWTDPNVFYVSIHQAPFYPGTGHADEIGEGAGEGTTANIPLSAGAGDSEYAAAFERVIVPVLEEYRPGLVLISAGYDAHQNDPLAGMKLDAGSYARMTSSLVGIAERHAAGKIALILEGGYDLSALEASLATSLQALAGRGPKLPQPGPPAYVFEREIEHSRAALRDRWPSLGGGLAPDRPGP